MGATASNAKHGKPRNGTGKRYSEGFLGFVDIPLSEHDKLAIQGWVEDGKLDVSSFVCQLAEYGYKFSLVTDFEHSSSIATATGKHETNPNNGYALSARGPNPFAAIVVLWYKISQLCDWEAWTAKGETASQQLSMFR